MRALPEKQAILLQVLRLKAELLQAQRDAALYALIVVRDMLAGSGLEADALQVARAAIGNVGVQS
jgi:hypothetical protein